MSTASRSRDVLVADAPDHRELQERRSSAPSSWRATSTRFRFTVYSLVLMRARRRPPWPGGIVASVTILLSLAGATQAAAATQVRFLHALPGGPTAELTVKGGAVPRRRSAGSASARSPTRDAGPSGAVTVTLSAGGKEVASATETLADGGSYTIVAEKGSGSKPQFSVYRAGKPVPGKASVRAVQRRARAGPGVDVPGRPGLGHGGLRPGHRLQARRPRDVRPVGHEARHEDRSGHPEGRDGHAPARAATAYAVGSAGERTRFVVVADAVAAPSGGPATGPRRPVRRRRRAVAGGPAGRPGRRDRRAACCTPARRAAVPAAETPPRRSRLGLALAVLLPALIAAGAVLWLGTRDDDEAPAPVTAQRRRVAPHPGRPRQPRRCARSWPPPAAAASAATTWRTWPAACGPRCRPDRHPRRARGHGGRRRGHGPRRRHPRAQPGPRRLVRRRAAARGAGPGGDHRPPGHQARARAVRAGAVAAHRRGHPHHRPARPRARLPRGGPRPGAQGPLPHRRRSTAAPGGSALVLVTCGGPYDQRDGYRDNILVYAGRPEPRSVSSGG